MIWSCCSGLHHCNGTKDIYVYDKFSWGFFNCLTPFFQRQFGLINCIIFIKEFISLSMIAIEIGKRQFLSYYSNGSYEEKRFIKNLNLIDLTYHCKNLVDWISARWDQISQLRKCKFFEKGREVKNIAILHFMTLSAISLLE